MSDVHDDDDSVEPEPNDDNSSESGDPGATAKAVLEYVVSALVEDEQAVRVDIDDSRRTLQLEVRVGPDDMGRVIGRRGRVATPFARSPALPQPAMVSRSTSSSSTRGSGGDMPRPEHLLSIGYIRKAHGLHGEVLLRLITNRSERLESGAKLFTDDGSLEVFRSRAIDKDYLVFFVGVTNRTGAEALKGIELFAEPIDDPDELWVHELVGARLVDQNGLARGVVESVEANPASDLLVLDNGALVPSRFITSFDDGVVQVLAPDGLFDL